ncbi:hypothetical protein BUALT_Bualt10G0116000 [Buddleja alternifolia]|uniref:Exostosin GT47 domain-containing protein n=1 Tax=Buddleja alternifolia TaxID=168488 RepID=A0AAV6X6K0_9LAMI|nr:hypothetical protein BUALT_Bualt10G0116000 [Buddleja alternifolia]
METRRLLWLMALIFSVVLLVQYIELPYGYVSSSLLSFGKSRVTSPSSNLARVSSNDTGNLAKKMIFGGMNSTKLNASANSLPLLSTTSASNSSLDNVNRSSSNGSSNDTGKLAKKMVFGGTNSTKLNASVNNVPVLSTTSASNSSLESLRAATTIPISGKNEEKISQVTTPAKKKRFKGPPAVVVPISAMNDMLSQSRVSYRSMWPSKVDQELLNAKTLIENAPIIDKDPRVDVNVYRNFSSFVRSYELMEQTLKIYIYTEGERPIFHESELNGIYASEGWFMKLLEENKHFVTKNPDKAHIFYLPFSSRMLEETLYVPNSHSRKNLVQHLSSYLKNITTKHRFWNRASGADHFLVACHDWAPAETSRIMRNCIRALCNADVMGGGFKFGKDVSLPEIYIRNAENPLKDLGGKPSHQRRILAFFAGSMHGYLRPILLNYWQNKDPEMKIFGKLHNKKGEISYIQYMKSSKYCISAKGYEPYTPRVMEAIYYECVPVIISDNYVPPFFETLNWETFAVFVLEKDIPNLKNILLSIPEERYVKMQERVKQVQKHFLWHSTPLKYDVFHMILHSGFRMGNEFRYVCLVETRRLLLLMGVVFGLILFVQYFELPYSNILSSLFAGGKSQVAPIDGFPSRNLTYFSSLNSTGPNVSDGKDSDATNVKKDFDSENKKSSDDTLNDDIDPEDESPSKDFLKTDHNSSIQSSARNNSFSLEKAREFEDELPASDYTSNNSASMDHNGAGDVNQTSGKKNEEKTADQETPAVAKSPETRSSTKSVPQKNKNMKKRFKEPEPAVVTISRMNDMLLQSRVSNRTVKPRWSSAVDQELRNTKSLIESAPIIEKDPQFDVSLYRNFSAFRRSYELMEKTLKVYIYAEGERPIFHQPPLKGIYASEGWFMKLLKANKRFVTKNPKKAHLFYLPFSSRMLEVTLYVPNSHSRSNLIEALSNYIGMITRKHNFWNRTGGADHFLVACHDWAPAETREKMANCIRALCNADVKEGFKFGNDVSLPETYVQSPQHLLRELGGKPPSRRRILAFFAGNMHGYLRPILLNYWENKDPDMKIFGRIRKVKGQMSYAQYMKTSKYCICAKGYEVNSPRVVEAIFYECVPVIISDNFVPPFFETLNWKSFAVFVLEKDIPNLKNILMSIPKKRYLQMHKRVKQESSSAQISNFTEKNKTDRTNTVPSVSISQMNQMLLESRSSLNSKQPPLLFSAVDEELLHAKLEIENTPLLHHDSGLYEPLYRNVSKFERSYELMDKMLRVYIYKDGEKPIFHESILEGIYASEGWFLKLLESNKQFVTEDPGKAHLFYLPFSSRLLELTLYVRNSHSRNNLIEFMKNYVEMLIQKYPFWNRTNGEDHFLAACHDWVRHSCFWFH